MARLLVGTCSWKYDSWKGLVYSADVVNHLAEYSRRYATVEVDQWFWSLHTLDHAALPQAGVVQEYSRSVPADFIFTVKAPNSLTLTHAYEKDKNRPLRANPFFLSTDLYSRFLQTLAPLHAHLGVILFQFEYLNRQKMASQNEFHNRLASFLSSCDRRFPLAIEIRNPNFLNQSFFDLLQTHDAAMVLLQGYYMPSAIDLYEKWEKWLQKRVVIRLHGPDRQGMEEKSGLKWDRILTPRDDELQAFCRIITQMLQRDLDVFLNVNNHYEGSAPLTIERIHQRLSLSGVK